MIEHRIRRCDVPEHTGYQNALFRWVVARWYLVHETSYLLNWMKAPTDTHRSATTFSQLVVKSKIDPLTIDGANQMLAELHAAEFDVPVWHVLEPVTWLMYINKLHSGPHPVRAEDKGMFRRVLSADGPVQLTFPRAVAAFNAKIERELSAVSHKNTTATIQAVPKPSPSKPASKSSSSSSSSSAAAISKRKPNPPSKKADDDDDGDDDDEEEDEDEEDEDEDEEQEDDKDEPPAPKSMRANPKAMAIRSALAQSTRGASQSRSNSKSSSSSSSSSSSVKTSATSASSKGAGSKRTTRANVINIASDDDDDDDNEEEEEASIRASKPQTPSSSSSSLSLANRVPSPVRQRIVF